MLLHLLSRGNSRITSASSDGKVSLNQKYSSNPLDHEILARHVRYIRKIVSAEPLSLLKPGGRMSHGALSNMDTLDEFREYVKEPVSSTWHTTSTCAMLPIEKGGHC